MCLLNSVSILSTNRSLLFLPLLLSNNAIEDPLQGG